VLDVAWRGMLRGSVAQSRAIPSMSAAPTPSAELPPVPMAEDEEPDEARSDRVQPGAADTEEQGEAADAPSKSV